MKLILPVDATTGRWVVARTSGRAHLDLGGRSSQSLRVNAEHIIVTACHAHIRADADVVSDDHKLRCSNCVRIARARLPTSGKLGVSPIRSSEAESGLNVARAG